MPTLISRFEDRLDTYFLIRERGSSLVREARGALATFLTMGYILVANPQILSAAGVPQQPAVAGTALAASICCILMGLWANFPLATASGMGLNAFVAFVVAPTLGSWQAAMGLIVIDGIVVLLLVLAGLREAVLEAIPRDLRLAIGAGIGLFIAFIGMSNAGFVTRGPAPGPFVSPGTLTSAPTAVAALGLLLTAALLAARVPGAILIGIAVSTVAAFLSGVAGAPSHIVSAPHFDTVFRANLHGALHWTSLPLLLSLVMVDFFDTLGTATAVAEGGHIVGPDGKIPGLRRVLQVDGIAASVGGLCGVSSVTAYIESAAGVAEGARTGLHSVLVGLLFLASIFFAPIAAAVPAQATAPALILVGFLMMAQIGRVDFGRRETAIPAFIILLTIPLTYSIAHGIGMGFITYVVIMLARAKPREIHPMMYLVAVAFAAFFIWHT
jgi:AGZA family xanthine/uracil permease-like MFS transporter